MPIWGWFFIAAIVVVAVAGLIVAPRRAVANGPSA